MANPSKKKGTRAETSVRKYLEAHGIKASRKALSGSDDHGDLEVDAPKLKGRLIMEVKAGKMTANPSRGQLAEWLRQTEVEAENSKCKGMLVVVRYNKKLCDADVWWQKPDQIQRTHMYLDEFCKLYGKEVR